MRRLADAGAVQLEVRRIQRRHSDRRSVPVDAAGAVISLSDVQREIADAACARSAAGRPSLSTGHLVLARVALRPKRRCA